MKKTLLSIAMALALAVVNNAGAKMKGSDTDMNRGTMEVAHRYGQHMGCNCYCFGNGPGWNSANQKKFLKFMKETYELRKELLLLKFDYGEKLLNPATTMGVLFDMERDIRELQRQIREKAAHYQ